MPVSRTHPTRRTSPNVILMLLVGVGLLVFGAVSTNAQTVGARLLSTIPRTSR